MKKRNIIVIGASMGGLDALKRLFATLPSDLDAAIFIVWHMSPTVKGILPQAINQVCAIRAAHAVDAEKIMTNRIYIAPPDHHMLVEKDHIRITRGPKENRFRPAIDPLFRSAAYTFGSRVIGIILTGALDDGTGGLWTIKYHGGVALVQDPKEAEVPSMPNSAIREVTVDHIVPLEKMGGILVRLVSEPVKEKTQPSAGNDEKTKIEIRITAEGSKAGINIIEYGELSRYACPECHGVLTLLKDGNISRFRCHTGHAFTASGLLAILSEKVEESLYNAIRGVDECIFLLNHLGDHFAEANQGGIAAKYFQLAQKTQQRFELIRQAQIDHEDFTKPYEDEN